MAGRIRDEDIALVRERSAIADVVGERVQLRNAGGGELKGLCPFHDEKSPSFHVAPARGYYHCLAGDTEVITWEGTRAIKELAGGVHRVLNRDGRWVDAPFRSYGVQPLMKLTLSRNSMRKVVYATDEHRWFVRSGKRQVDVREVLTRDLRPGHRLPSVFAHSRVLGAATASGFGVAHGFTFGDGCLDNTGAARAYLTGEKDLPLLPYFGASRTSVDDVRITVFGLPRAFKRVPEASESTSYLLGWLAGLIAADGHVAKDGTVMLHAADRGVLDFVRDLCHRLGIGTYGITTQLREGFPGRELSEIHRIHFVNSTLPSALFVLPEMRARFEESKKLFERTGWVVESVEQTDRVEEVFCATVADGNAFVLADNILTGNCFGCGEGGDVITFMQKVEHLSFSESVEQLAQRVGIELRYEEGTAAMGQERGQRSKLIAAHAAAAAFYAEQLATPEAITARKFLAERGFDADTAARYGVGYAPKGWEALTTHLRTEGFKAEDLATAGLAKAGQRGPIDRFRGRLVWPIADISGDIIGFGARKLYEDDNGPKYLNTPETPLYKKSSVLYGLSLAKSDIAKRQQVVVVEGYTDVMACHLAGVPTAVATCGTSFGEEHIRVLRRLLMDQAEHSGEVIFTFDGDAAGQKAALRAFADEQKFVMQTFVAVTPGGLDPCDLRLAKGDAAVRDLVAARVPLYEFALRSTIDKFNLESEEGKLSALDAAAPIVAGIRDRGLRQRYAVNLDRWLGFMDEAFVLQRVADHADDKSGNQRRPVAGPAKAAPDPRDAGLLVERETLKLAIQRPAMIGPRFDALDADVFTAPAYAAVRDAIQTAGGCASSAGGGPWVAAVAEAADDDVTRGVVTQLAVEPLLSGGEVDDRYVSAHVVRIQEMAVTRQIVQIKSKLQRVNPVDEAEAYNKLFGELIALEGFKKRLRDNGIAGL